MNCLSAFTFASSGLRSALGPGIALLASIAALAGCGVPTSESADRPANQEYRVYYELRPDPAAMSVLVTMRVEQPNRQLRELEFSTRSGAITDVTGDGELRTDTGSVTWVPPASGGTLQWRAAVASPRGDGAFDALLDQSWGLFRAEDVIPRARSRTLKGARSRTTMRVIPPPGWSVVTEYPAIRDPILIERSGRRFDQPAGWMVMGDLGVRRETIAGTRVVIAGPENQDIRRMDMLALLNWTLPQLAMLLPGTLPRLTIVSAGDPMWRGGLSAPASLYIHADRPLISENATSTLLHEVMHVAAGFRSAPGYDWITEGFAEYYSIELLYRGGAITAERHDIAVKGIADWAKRAKSLCGSASSGARTAAAVTLLHALNREIIASTAGDANLDDVLRELVAADVPLDLELLAAATASLTGSPSDVLHSAELPGCRKIATNPDMD